MQQPLQVTFHNLPHSDALESEIRARVGKLEAVYERIIGCRIVVGCTHRNATKAKTYEVRIDIQMPGHEIVVSREPVGDLRFALNEAFDVARRRLKDHQGKLRGA